MLKIHRSTTARVWRKNQGVRKLFHFLRLLPHYCLIFGVLVSTGSYSADLNLPELGDGTSSVVSRQQEYELGQAWLRLFRSRVPSYDDPFVTEYLEELLEDLVQYSELKDKRLSVISVNNPTINAFAAPGGIVGVHTGLILSAENEHELVGVLAHELAHLSQRHWVRSVEKSQQNALPMMAAMLASLVLLSTTGGDAGMAALTATQAASLESSLRFSRQNEQEADRIGMKTMQAANYNPDAMADMFERMLMATRFAGQRPPEFLLTHPVTEKRIADSRLRASNMPNRIYPDSLQYHLIRARIQLHHAENPSIAIKRFNGEINGKTLNITASYYGLALAQIEALRLADARKTLEPLLKQYPKELMFLLASAELELLSGNFDNATAMSEELLTNHPRSLPARIFQVRLLYEQQKYSEADRVLTRLSYNRPHDTLVWYELAEVRGLAGNIYGVHMARAEYFLLNGIYDKARYQLNYAAQLIEPDNFMENARIEQKLRDIEKLENLSIRI